MKKVLISLQEYGLSPSESLVYITLLQLGPSSVLDISRKAKLNRATTHLNISSLIERGLATQIQKGNKRAIIAEPPEKISYLIEQEKSTISRKESGLNNVIESIYDEIDKVKENTSSQVKYYEGVRAVQRVYNDILTSPTIKAYVSPEQIWEKLPDNYNSFPEAMKKGLYMQDIVSKDKYQKLFEDTYTNMKGIDFKFLPENSKLKSMDYLIYRDSIAIIQPTKNNNISAIVIKNEGLAINSTILFDLLWNILK
ncbi:MAG: helix-turn-helix domain-containing protein [Candidatus Dojkabacteria bacterium]